MVRMHAGKGARLRTKTRPKKAHMLVLVVVSIASVALGASAEEGDTHDHAHQESATPDGAGHEGHARPDGHAPIGVMGDHTHGEGEWMVSYRFMRMSMVGNRTGTRDVSVPEVLTDYMVSPIWMDMDMHMFGLMYAPNDRVTLMGMFPFLSLTMNHVNRMDVVFQTESTGIGDLGFSALVELFERSSNQLILNLGMTFPTGSINRTDVVPTSTGPESKLLPYPMQLGSGTWDLKPGLTYNGRTDWLSWGAQAIGTVRLGRNEQDYAEGDEYMLTAWGAWKVLDFASVSARLEWRQWFNYRGFDSRLGPPPFAVPTADPKLRAGRRLDIGPGVNFVVPGGFAKNLRLAFEMLFPVYQDLDGPQLKNDWTLVVGTQYAF